MKKMKVVWLCHFSDKEIKGILHPWRDVPEFAPWIVSFINAVENVTPFELHIVAPYLYIGHLREFELRGVYYHFYNPFLPIVGHPGLSIKGLSYYEYTNFRKSKKTVFRIVNRINPDIIHVIGAENPYYSAAVLPLVHCYPTILTIQGFISHTKSSITPSISKKIEIEEQVINSIPVCFVRSKAQANSVLEINSQMKLVSHMFCSYELKYDYIPEEKLYDLVFFAQISKDKGIVDLLKAMQLIKQRKPDVSLCVIGGGDFKEYVDLADKLGISDNVIWTGFLPSRKDVHFMAAQCRVSVLPTYSDMYPGTIIESMFLGIPMVSYDVDSNPEINEDYEAIRLVKVGDIDALSDSIYDLLINNDECQRLGLVGKKRAYEMFAPSNTTMVDQWMKGYQLATELFNNGNKFI